MSAPINTVAPAITGDVLAGSVLTVSTGTWTGLVRESFDYAWLRDGVPINEENVNTYTSSNSDVGKTITCEVTATNLTNEASSVLVNVLAYNTPAPIITEENNDTNTFAWTATGNVEINLKSAGWLDAVSPFDVGYNDYAIGEIEIRVKAEGINPVSAVASNTIAFTAADQINICKVYMYVKDLLGADTDVVKVKQVPCSVKYKEQTTVVSQVITATPNVTTGYVEFDLIETANMTGGQYLIDFGCSAYKFQVPNQAEANFWDLSPVASDARIN
jgi:hypothetical protein